MPDFLERKLRAEYGNNPRAIYGTMNAIGAMRGNKITAKGREMENKHMKDHGLREMRIEVHRDKAGKITGHTVHHHPVMKRSKKEPAFLDSGEPESHPFAAGAHKQMMAHIAKHLSAPSVAPAGNANQDAEYDDDEGGGELD